MVEAGCLGKTTIQILLEKSLPIFLHKNCALRGIQMSKPDLVGLLNWMRRRITEFKLEPNVWFGNIPPPELHMDAGR